MNDEMKYPFQLINIFAVSISIRRDGTLPKQIELPTNVAVQYTEPGFPRVQFAMKIEVAEDLPISMRLEVVGIFDYNGTKKKYDRGLNKEFAEERALHMLWVHSNQLVKAVSAQMGMNPLEMKNPAEFRLADMVPIDKKKSRTNKSKKTKKPA